MANEKKTTKVPAKPKKKFFLLRWWDFIKASYNELKKVIWPTKKELFKGTWVTVLIIAVFAVVIALLDTIFTTISNLFYNIV